MGQNQRMIFPYWNQESLSRDDNFFDDTRVTRRFLVTVSMNCTNSFRFWSRTSVFIIPNLGLMYIGHRGLRKLVGNSCLFWWNFHFYEIIGSQIKYCRVTAIRGFFQSHGLFQNIFICLQSLQDLFC